MEDDDIKLLNMKRVRSVANLRRLKLSHLDRFLEDKTIYEGDYLEMRLFLMYLKVYQPTNEDIMNLTHEVWADLDQDEIEDKYFAFGNVPDRGDSIASYSAAPPKVVFKKKVVAPVLDDDDDLTKDINIDINSVVKSLWIDRSSYPIVPKCEAKDVVEAFGKNIDLPKEGESIDAVIDNTMGLISKYARRIQNPGHFGFIAASGVPTDPLSFAMTAAVNQNVPAYTGSPIMSTMERTVISWLCELVGFDKTSDGCLLSGGSTSNLTAVATSLAHRFGPEYREKGLLNMLKPGEKPVVICSAATHFCVQRAAGMLGIGVDNVIPIEGDDNFSMRLDVLKEAIEANPCVVCVVANAGSTTTGAIDPIDEIADLCASRNIWLHVDGAYGGSALMSPELAPLFKGIEKADSVTMDLHKWFFMSYDCSAIVFKNPKYVNWLFNEQSNVVKELSIDTFASTLLFFNLGPELSRRARCLPIYIAFRHYGIERMGKNVLYQVNCAKYLAALADEDADFEVVTRPKLSVVTFRMSPYILRENQNTEKIDELNAFIRDKLEEEGNYFLSGTKVKGRTVLRVCIVDHNARAKNIKSLFEEIKKIGNDWMMENVQ